MESKKRVVPFHVAVIVAALCTASLLAFHFSLPVTHWMNQDKSARNIVRMDSDQVEGLFWAEASLKARRPLNSDFYYPYAIPYGSNLLLAPFVRTLGMRVLSNQLGMLLFSFLFLGVAYSFIRTFSTRWQGGVIGAAVFFLAFRSVVGRNLLHHVLYYQLSVLCALGMMAPLFQAHSQGRLKLSQGLAAAFFAAWSFANGGILAAMSVAPVVLGVVFACLGRRDERLLPVLRPYMVAIGVGSFIGYFAYFIAMQGIEETGYIAKAGSFMFASVEEWWARFLELPQKWLGLFFPFGTKGVAIGSVRGIDVLLSLVMALLVTAAPACLVPDVARQGFRGWVLLVYAACIWGLCLSQFILFRGKTPHLLYDGVLINFLLIAVSVVAGDRLERIRMAILLPVGALLVFWCAFFPWAAVWKMDKTLVRELKARALTYGGATYWNALGNTVLSKGRARIEPVVFKADGGVHPRRHNSAASRYHPLSPGSQGFLLLDEDEWQTAMHAPNDMLIRLAHDLFTCDGYHVLVYTPDHWWKMLSGAVYSYNFQAGKWTRNCSEKEDGRHIHPGGVSYGPGRKLDKGAKCTVLIRGRNLDKASLSVYGVRGKRVYFRPEFQRKTCTELLFSVISDIDLEKFEVAIHNQQNAGDVILASEILEISF